MARQIEYCLGIFPEQACNDLASGRITKGRQLFLEQGHACVIVEALMYQRICPAVPAFRCCRLEGIGIVASKIYA